MDLLLGAVVLGVLLGCFYAAVSVGLSVSFGLLDVPHVAHPAFLVLASYGVYQLNESYDIDPLLAGSSSRRCSSCSACSPTASITRPSRGAAATPASAASRFSSASPSSSRC
jgi:branched-subunit amino acid ABC-type transport system permease component